MKNTVSVPPWLSLEWLCFFEDSEVYLVGGKCAWFPAGTAWVKRSVALLCEAGSGPAPGWVAGGWLRCSSLVPFLGFSCYKMPTLLHAHTQQGSSTSGAVTSMGSTVAGQPLPSLQLLACLWWCPSRWHLHLGGPCSISPFPGTRESFLPNLLKNRGGIVLARASQGAPCSCWSASQEASK